MKVTLEHIAQIAGVHRSTVDKVLHGRKGVSDKIRAHIQQIVDELEYSPDPIGRALANQRKPKTIAVLLLKFDALDEIKQGIEAALSEVKNFGIETEYYVCNDSDSDEQLFTLKYLLNKKVSGVLITPIHTQEITRLINEISDQGIPVVTINTDIPESKRICFIGQESLKAGRVAGELMGEIIGGHGNVALITSSKELLSSLERQQGFENVLSEHFPRIKVIDVAETFEKPVVAFQKTLEIIKKHGDLDGLFITCGNVSEICRAVKLMNKDKKIKIISYDLYPEIIQLVNQRVINFTIGQNLFTQGYRGFIVLSEVLLFAKKPDTEIIWSGIDIRIRESV